MGPHRGPLHPVRPGSSDGEAAGSSTVRSWERCVISPPPHSQERGYRVELGKHSLVAGEEGSLSRGAAVIVAHEDYNILLSRLQRQPRANFAPSLRTRRA